MTDLDDYGDLIVRLGRLGDALDLDDTDVTERVLARIRVRSSSSPHRRTRWLVAAVVLALVAGVAVASPTSRRAVARWFGLDGLTIEVDPDASLPVRALTFDVPGPGETVVVDVDGRQIIVSAVRGDLTERWIGKVVGSSEQIEEVTVDGHRGLWFSGVPHEVLYDSPTGDVVVERVAVDTLLWQDDDALFRVEGFDRLAEAIEFVEGT